MDEDNELVLMLEEDYDLMVLIELVLLIQLFYLNDEEYSKMNQMKQFHHQQVLLIEQDLVLKNNKKKNRFYQLNFVFITTSFFCI